VLFISIMLPKKRVPDITTCTSSAFDSFKSNATSLAQRGSFDANEPHVLNNWTSAADLDISVSCISNPVDTNTQQSEYFGPAEIPIITVSTSFEFDDLGMLNIVRLLNPGHEDRAKISITAEHKEVYVGD